MTGLTIDRLTVRFGGRVAVDHLTLEAPSRVVTGLIGPNGAGKTTTFNACTGVVPLSGGAVRLDGRDLSRCAPAARARLGLGRTFQHIELYDSMTVAENVALGPEAVIAGRRLWSHVLSRTPEREEIAHRTMEALQRCGLSPIATEIVRDLPTGQRRLVELARAVASPFRFLLFDEPSSGLGPGETERLGRILLGLASSGRGILLVEHDMALVRQVCSYVYVLDFGKLIFEGTMEAVATSPTVRAAYLGSEVA